MLLSNLDKYGIGDFLCLFVITQIDVVQPKFVGPHKLLLERRWRKSHEESICLFVEETWEVDFFEQEGLKEGERS